MVGSKLTPDDGIPVAGLALKVTRAEYEGLRGRWVAVDEDGFVKLSGASFEEVDRAATAAGLSAASVEFVFIPKHDLAA